MMHNPIIDYPRFFVNWIKNRFNPDIKSLQQCYMATVARSEIGENVKVYPHAAVGHSSIGSHSYIGPASKVRHTSIGKFCSIGANCIIGAGQHPIEYVSTSPSFYSISSGPTHHFSDKEYFTPYKPINIGNDVWIGDSVVVMGGITIADGAIVGARAVVTRDVPSYSIYGGIPAKFIRYRFPKNIRDFLLKIRWWEQDDRWLRENFKFFHDVEAFRTFVENDNALN
ncbi:MAG: CatB-related O-acetyltransferase [Cyanobacteria bacterium P01_F01_bin.150]